MHPIKIENAVDLPDQMIRRHHVVEIDHVEELTLSALSPPPSSTASRQSQFLIHGITVQPQSQREFCNTIGGEADTREIPALAKNDENDPCQT